MVELLAPAGDAEKLNIAFHYGADAVYFAGQDYGLRANAKNFTNKEIEKAVKYAHSLNKKVYVTVNIVFHDEDFEGLEEYLIFLDKIKVDGIMVSDVSVLDLCNKLNLKLNRYISTQASVLNKEAALFYKEMGAKRIVLAREAMKEDVKEIKKATNLSIETFIHGAMCTSFSGRCILSNYSTNRDSNRGGCAQVCRWNFILKGKDKNVISEDFFMASKDLNMSSLVMEMINSGIDSFKIEGRMRSIYYIATVLHVYKNLLKKLSTNTLNESYNNYYQNVLSRCANRESTPQFFNQKASSLDQYFLTSREEVSNQDFLGIVLENKDGVITIEQRNHFKIGDEVQFFGPNIEDITIKIDKIYNEKGEEITVANHPKMIIKIKKDLPVSKFDMMRVKIFDI